MSLSAGARLGPYEIVAPLGAGGMGEVYRAKDGRLNRTVAIKVMPADAAGDAERRERFEREAKAISALDHPNICALYDVGEHEGTYFLVMPCLEGHTLAGRIAKGAIPVDQAIKIAIEIATALDAAHRHGIVHRDLKPGNVMLTKTGVKLLDFGLAKLKKAEGPLGHTTMAKGTGIGTLLGTMPYMSPEQIEGRDVDARSDIFSLGAVIYEMITGERAFKGETAASVIGSILKDEPAPITKLQPLAPAALDYVIATCLAKDPDERWQSVADTARQLRWSAAAGVGSVAGAASRSRWPERTAWIALTTAVVAALLIARPEPRVVDADAVRLFLNPPPGHVFTAVSTATVPTPQFAISHDGRLIAFVASEDELRSALWVRSLANVEARRLAGTDGAQDPFWSPDNRWIGFYDQAGTMKRVSVQEGTVQTITTGIPDPRGGSWGWDDVIAFGTGFGPIFTVRASGGEPPLMLTELDRDRQEGSHRWPQLLPDGQHFLYTIRTAVPELRGVYVGSRDGQTRRKLLDGTGDVQFVAPDTLLFLDGGTLLAQAFDARRLELTGRVTPIASNVGRSSRGNGAFSVASTGELLYSAPTLRPSRLTWLDRSGTPLGAVAPEGDFVDARLSPDDQQVAFSLVDPTASFPDIWIADLARGGATRFTFGPLNSAPVWSPRRERIVFRSNRRGFTELFQKTTSSGGTDEALIDLDAARSVGLSTSNMIASDWSGDGQHLLVAGGVPADIWWVPVADPRKAQRVVESVGDQFHASLSPDARYVAYTSTESGRRFDVYTQALGGSGGKWLVTPDGGYEPRWRADGTEIYYLAPNGMLMAVPVVAGAMPFGVPKPLFRANVHPDISMLRTHYTSSRDGSRFLVSVRSGNTDFVPITVVLNWRAGAGQ